jgi:hypothetical protein
VSWRRALISTLLKLGLGQVPFVIWGIGLHLKLKTNDIDKVYI